MKKFKVFFSILLFLVGLIIIGCCNDHDDDDAPGFCSEEGVIIGIDTRICACCGGWFIETNGDTLRATVIPEAFRDSVDPNEFPLPIFLEWTEPLTLCTSDEIVVDCIRRR